jgi:SAM-dependent methyltransferase
MAESFGAVAERYDRVRPSYPQEMVTRIVAAAPGRSVLDVGCGTGIAARQFQAAGCDVLGVEIDEKMAEVARRHGIAVEVSPFETWRAGGRVFDAVVAGQTWHWVDPVAGAVKAAEVLCPGGRLAVFWNVGAPPAHLGTAFADIYRRLVPGFPVPAKQAGYSAFVDAVAGGLRPTGLFTEPEEWTFAWKQPYTRDEWLDHVPTVGGHSRFPEEQMTELLSALGAAIDAEGGAFTMDYTTVVVTAERD